MAKTTFWVDGKSFVLRTLRDDTDFLALLGRRFPAAGRYLFAIDDPAIDHLRDRDELIAAIDELLAPIIADEITNDKYVLDFAYGVGISFKGATEATGLRIEGRSEWCLLRAGVAQCYLGEWRPREGALPELIPVLDLRNEKLLRTENCGDIKIRKVRSKVTADKQLVQLKEFLEQLPPGIVYHSWGAK